MGGCCSGVKAKQSSLNNPNLAPIQSDLKAFKHIKQHKAKPILADSHRGNLNMANPGGADVDDIRGENIDDIYVEI